MSEWANFRGKGPNGWSGRGGQCTSPYLPLGDPSGSSSGSAVAAAIGLAPACVGTETDGSIVSPSERNNIVGVKPTVGLTSRYGGDLFMVVPLHCELIKTLGISHPHCHHTRYSGSNGKMCDRCRHPP